jgi:hypothetical protein
MPSCLNTRSRASVTDSDELGAETMAAPPAATDLFLTDDEALR